MTPSERSHKRTDQVLHAHVGQWRLPKLEEIKCKGKISQTTAPDALNVRSVAPSC